MYEAIFYVRINGIVYKPGECIPDGLPEEKITRLLGRGAIKQVAPAPEAAKAPEQADGFPFPEVLEDPGDGFPEGEPVEEPEEEPEEDEEAPEIDVMAGIVQEEQEEEKEPEKPARAKTPKKTAERRKQK